MLYVQYALKVLKGVSLEKMAAYQTMQIPHYREHKGIISIYRLVLLISEPHLGKLLHKWLDHTGSALITSLDGSPIKSHMGSKQGNVTHSSSADAFPQNWCALGLVRMPVLEKRVSLTHLPIHFPKTAILWDWCVWRHRVLVVWEMLLCFFNVKRAIHCLM